jgi:hypothetical protein
VNPLCISIVAIGRYFSHCGPKQLIEESFLTMVLFTRFVRAAVLMPALALPAAAQTNPPATEPVPVQSPLPPPSTGPVEWNSAPTLASNAVEQLLAFKDSEVKFNLRDLMAILSDRRHEGWVLAAYPDPKTAQPLIGAGFSLDLPARQHPQLDPLNSHPFLEPSSAELWQAAGLDSEKLPVILKEFNARLDAWDKKGFRKRIKMLEPQIADEDAELLLRIGIIQAIYNAKGYCRNFDQFSASQQMAVTQLVYQMGVNLGEFSQFLNLINNYAAGAESNAEVHVENAFAADAPYWKSVQQSLVQSQWARLYRARAVAVIAMLDPQYTDEPGTAEHRVGAMLRPPVAGRRAGPAVSTRLVAAHRSHSTRTRAGATSRKGKSRSEKKRSV